MGGKVIFGVSPNKGNGSALRCPWVRQFTTSADGLTVDGKADGENFVQMPLSRISTTETKTTLNVRTQKK